VTDQTNGTTCPPRPFTSMRGRCGSRRTSSSFIPSSYPCGGEDRITSRGSPHKAPSATLASYRSPPASSGCSFGSSERSNCAGRAAQSRPVTLLGARIACSPLRERLIPTPCECTQHHPGDRSEASVAHLHLRCGPPTSCRRSRRSFRCRVPSRNAPTWSGSRSEIEEACHACPLSAPKPNDIVAST